MVHTILMSTELTKRKELIKILESFGLKETDAQMLFEISKSESPISISELTKKLNQNGVKVNRANAYSISQRLENEGLVDVSQEHPSKRLSIHGGSSNILENFKTVFKSKMDRMNNAIKNNENFINSLYNKDSMNKDFLEKPFFNNLNVEIAYSMIKDKIRHTKGFIVGNYVDIRSLYLNDVLDYSSFKKSFGYEIITNGPDRKYKEDDTNIKNIIDSSKKVKDSLPFYILYKNSDDEGVFIFEKTQPNIYYKRAMKNLVHHTNQKTIVETYNILSEKLLE